MADETYQPKTYRDRGGDRLNIVSGGAVSAESGSTCSFAGSVLQSQANANATTAGASLTASGITVVAATSGVQPTFHLGAPKNGAYVHLIAGQAGSTSMTISTTGVSATIGSTFTKLAFTKNTYGTAALRGRSATRWDVIGLHGTNAALS